MVTNNLEPPVDTDNNHSWSCEQPAGIHTIDDLKYPMDRVNDNIPLPLEDPLARDSLVRPGEHPSPATPDLSEHHPNIETRFHKPSVRVLAGPTITNCLCELSVDPPANSGDQNCLSGQQMDLGPAETTLLCNPGKSMLETIKVLADLTPQTLELILKDYQGRVTFPNLKVKIPQDND